MKTPVKQKRKFGDMAKAKAKETVANTNKTPGGKVMAGIAAKAAAKKEAKAAAKPAPERKFGDMAKAKAATKPAPATKPATTPAPMQKYGAAKGKPAAKMKKC